MGKLKELRAAYVSCKSGSAKEREIVEDIKKIVESEWWDKNVGKPFNWPTKSSKSWLFGYSEDTGFTTHGHFIFWTKQKDFYTKLLSL